MARGASRAQSELPASAPTRKEVTATLFNKVGQDMMRLGTKYSRLAETDKELDGKLAKFIEAWAAYQGDRHFEQKGHKKRRQELVDTVNELPKELQEAITVPNSFIKRLFRGGNHATNPGPDGKINASFTARKEHAQGFGTEAQSSSEHKRYDLYEEKRSEGGYQTYAQRVYSAKDIESFDKILSYPKALALIWGMRKLDDARHARVLDREIYDELPAGSTRKPDLFDIYDKPLVQRYSNAQVDKSLKDFRVSRGKRGKAMDEMYSNSYGEEDEEYQPDEKYGDFDYQEEYIVTGIKWKSGVK